MIYTYDGSYEGLLTVVFETYRMRQSATEIVAADRYQERLFEQPIAIETDGELAERVRAGLVRMGGDAADRLLYRVYLSEQPELEAVIYHAVRRIMKEGADALQDYTDDLILKAHQLDKKMGREVHRMHAFVRFQETQDGMYVAFIEPDFNVLPLIGEHFEDRYPAMHWLIYDVKRHYGLHYHEHHSEFTTFTERQHRIISQDLLTDTEQDYQALWKTYFKSVDIPERRNLKLHYQHVPKRYWKWLVEK